MPAITCCARPETFDSQSCGCPESRAVLPKLVVQQGAFMQEVTTFPAHRDWLLMNSYRLGQSLSATRAMSLRADVQSLVVQLALARQGSEVSSLRDHCLPSGVDEASSMQCLVQG